jgi:hypothetical protein
MRRIARVLRHGGPLAFLSLAADRGLAQYIPPPVTVGSHIRYRRVGSDSALIPGRLRRIGRDSIFVTLDADTSERMPIAAADLDRLEIERDAKARDHAAAVLGTLGAVAGATTGYFWCQHNVLQCAEEHRELDYAEAHDSTYYGTQFLMLVGGAAVGAVLGYAIAPPPHWDVVAFPTRTTNNDGAPGVGMNIGVRYWLANRRR